MPKDKSQFIDPLVLRRPGTLKFKDIPLNAFNKRVSDLTDEYSRADFLNMFEDMLTARAFEETIAEIKRRGEFGGVKTDLPAHCHLSTGQEAQAVGQAFYLGREDLIFGNHRSHHEIIAKAFSAMRKMPAADLKAAMEAENDGKTLRVVSENADAEGVALGKEFFLYGAACEILARANGFARGIAGGMHLFFPAFGIFPNNAIVGGSAPLAAGAALFKKCNGGRGIVVANLGDGAAGCGPVYEALNFSAMAQYDALWGDGFGGGLPVIFSFNNNGYAMGGRTAAETMAYGVLARLGAGVCESQLHSERADGCDVLAVADAFKRQKAIIERGEGPAMLDIVTYRQSGHSTGDAESYRTEKERAAWRAADPIESFKKQLLAAKTATESELRAVADAVRERNRRAFTLAADARISPAADYSEKPRFIEGFMFGNANVENAGDKKPVVLAPKDENPRVREIAKKARFAGGASADSSRFNVCDALFEAIHDKFYVDSSLISYGEDVRGWDGPLTVYRGLDRSLPYSRLFNSPISESAIVGTATGYAMAGGRVIGELMYCDFMGRAGDEIFNQMAKWRGMSAGALKMPVVLRVPVGSDYGAQHSQDWTALAAHIPGLKVVFPVTPYDCKGLMNAALNGTDPVIFFESRKTYGTGELFRKAGVPRGFYEIPFGAPDVKRAGTDVTVLTIGAALYTACRAADVLRDKYGVSAEIIDARCAVPFDYDLVLRSVKKTGKILLVGEACARGSVLNTFAADIARLAFSELNAPPVVLGAENRIIPQAGCIDRFFPDEERIVEAVGAELLGLKGFEAARGLRTAEFLRKTRGGV